ncbi:outer membrane protein [Escherichia phage vB_EcoS_SH2]|uniref:Uncharacterized protein n=2 Tax=Tunavirus TaxID=187217 RepID=A0A1Z1LX43_9CAUD|nr:outer membrane protein [Escherichia phage vB_EcoS_SH2]ARW57234.1 hypothetical protein [Escherichia phage vB_EcoS_SH2]
MAYGISTWDANGVYNNYGIKPITVVGWNFLSAGQNSASFSYQVPPGMHVNYVISLDDGAISGPGRKIIASGNTITVTPTNSPEPNVYPSSNCYLIAYLEND